MTLLRKNTSGWLVVIILSLLPILLWWQAPTVIPRWQSNSNTLPSLGQLAALVGTAMFALNFVLSARFVFLEKLFNGLNKVYDWHIRFGQIAFILLIFHPLLLLPRYAGSSALQSIKFLLPINDLAQNLGWFALAGMILLIILSLYLKLKYNTWKWTHKFFGLFFLLGTIHSLLIPSDLSAYQPLKYYMLLLIIIGLVSYAYHTLFSRWLVKTYSYLVSSVQSLNNEVVEISMASEGPKLKYQPGQFIFISFDNHKVGKEWHPFSIASAPDEDELIIAVKKLGDFTKRLDKLQPGDKVKIQGPFGVFNYEKAKYKEQIWIAGGIGITPFISMARSLKSNPDYKIDLYYCTRNKNQLVYLKNLENQSNIHISPHFSESQGLISGDKISQLSGTLDNKSIYLCAPPAMIKSLKEQLLKAGVNRSLIHSEEFNFN